MNTKLDEKQELIKKVETLSVSDIQKLKVFIAGIEAGKAVRDSGERVLKQTAG